jgi:predicted DNA-binding transcriptional regulator AlpA
VTPTGPASAATEELCEEIRHAIPSQPSSVAAWLTAQIRATLAQGVVLAAALQRVEPPKETAPSRLLTPTETAALLRVDLRWIRRHTPQIPHRKLGKYVRFSEREVIRWYEARKR